MNHLTAITAYIPGPWFEKTLLILTTSDLIEDVLVICPEMVDIKIPKSRVVKGSGLQSQKTLAYVIEEARTKYLLFLTGTKQVSIEPGGLKRLVATAESTKAGIVYSDFFDEGGQGRALYPLNDYQLGSVRDDFEFGGIMLFSTEAARKALEKYGEIPGVTYAGLS